MSDYNFRGISQSNRGPSFTVYVETRYNVNSSVQFYLAGQYWAVTLPTNPTAEVDTFGGVRFTAGSFGLDIGGMYYWYPREKQHNDAFFAVGQAPFPTYPNGNALTPADADLLGSVRQGRPTTSSRTGSRSAPAFYYSPSG